MKFLDYFLQENHQKNKSVIEQKQFLRKYLLEKRKEEFNTFKKKEEWGKDKFQKLLETFGCNSQEELETQFLIACFFPINSELNFLPFAKPYWLFPKVSNQDLLWFEYGDGKKDYFLNKWCIPEKEKKFCFEYRQTDKPFLCITPGIAGDQNGFRLGYGRGFYDRFLKKHAEITSILCLPSDKFFFDKLPKESHDTTVKYIIY